MQLREALNDIAEIRSQIERTETFRGLRSAAVSASSLLVFCGALTSHFLPLEQDSISGFIVTWAIVAVFSLGVVFLEMWFRASQSSTPANRGFVWQAHRALAIHLAPSLFVGAVFTSLFVLRPEMSWALPGAWAMIYSLGLMSCHQHLPTAAKWAVVYFMVAGAGCLFGAADQTQLNSNLANWQMVALFGVGQLALAFLIYWKLERLDGETEN